MKQLIDSVSTKCATFSLIEEGILRIELLENSEIDLAESKEMQKNQYKLPRIKNLLL